MGKFKNTINAWSYSRLSLYRKCPRMFRYKTIDKLPTEDNYASSRGSIMHAKCEQFVNGNIFGMPPELKGFSYELKELKRLQADTEADLSVAMGWNKSHGKDWGNVWCRMYLDVSLVEGTHADVIDYKSGRVYEESHEEQGKLYATGVFAHYPNVLTANVEMWYLDLKSENEEGEIIKTLEWEYSRKEFPALKKYWEKASKPLFRDTDFKPTPSDNACRWCDFKENCKKEKGGIK